MGVAWKNGAIAVYNVGRSFYLHQHCALIQLSAEALTASLQFEETVSGVGGGDGVAGCSQGGVLEKALDGIKVAIADLQDMENTMASDAAGSMGSSGSSVTVSACCVLQSSGPDGTAVVPAVVVGCSLVLPGEAKALLVTYALQGRREGEGDATYPATASLTQIVHVPAVSETERQSVLPTITDIVPCAGGRYLAVNVVYEEAKGWEQMGTTCESTTKDDGCLRETEAASCGGDAGNSNSHNIVCSQTLLFEVGEETGAKGYSPPRPTSLSQSPVGRKIGHDPGARLVSLVEARHGDSREAINLVGVTVDGRVLELVGEGLDCRVVVSPEQDPVVLCAPCIGLEQLVVVRESSRMELIRLSGGMVSASEEGGKGVEELDSSPGVGKHVTREKERQESEFDMYTAQFAQHAVAMLRVQVHVCWPALCHLIGAVGAGCQGRLAGSLNCQFVCIPICLSSPLCCRSQEST